ncbi:MAG: beta galactosidase jelly roll domain-containing protein [Armatimonadota bacterium]|nr:beta galactosidase jelly roll domain-containing protein [Armatimonadota bacterium]
MVRTTVSVLLCAFAATSLSAGTQEKKIVQYGGEPRDTAYVRQHVAEIEKVPLDGIAITVIGMDGSGKSTGSLGWQLFTKTSFRLEDCRRAVDDLKATKFKRFTENFIVCNSHPGQIDWFDPDWSIITHNVACLARVAKQGGCKGLMFDPEMYGEPPTPWSYTKLPENLRKAHTYPEYRDKARQRGREFIRAINKEFPDVVFFTLFGNSLSLEAAHSEARTPYGDSLYTLYSAFLDGILDAATPRTVLVDGHEWSYPYRRRAQFVKARKRVLGEGKDLSRNPVQFAKHVQAGFAVWSDMGSYRTGWHPEDFRKNYYTPAGLRASLNYALESSDRYVWVYSERLRWWGESNVPQEYLDALRLAKLGPGPGEKNPLSVAAINPVSAEWKGYSDAETFAEMRKTMTDVFDLPKDGWKFALDEPNRGAKLGWYRVDFDDSTWQTLSIGKWWEEQGVDYDGRAWYRRTFTPPALQPGKRVFLAFGGADDAAKVWLNGTFVAEHDIASGAEKAFTIEVTHLLRPEKANLLAVQIRDGQGYGGLWKSVKLMMK